MSNLTSFDKMKTLFSVSKTVKGFISKYKDMLKDKSDWQIQSCIESDNLTIVTT